MTGPNYDPVDRRPINSRNTRWAEGATQLLVNLGLSPNTISILGMLAAVAAGVAFYSTGITTGIGQRAWWLLAGGLCQVRLLCNLFDGMVAVKRGIASRKGELYNEVPDRVSDAAVFIGLGYSAGGDIAFGYLAALVSILAATNRFVFSLVDNEVRSFQTGSVASIFNHAQQQFANLAVDRHRFSVFAIDQNEMKQ